MAMMILNKTEDHTTFIQVALNQGFQKCSFYREQPIPSSKPTSEVEVAKALCLVHIHADLAEQTEQETRTANQKPPSLSVRVTQKSLNPGQAVDVCAGFVCGITFSYFIGRHLRYSRSEIRNRDDEEQNLKLRHCHVLTTILLLDEGQNCGQYRRDRIKHDRFTCNAFCNDNRQRIKFIFTNVFKTTTDFRLQAIELANPRGYIFHVRINSARDKASAKLTTVGTAACSETVRKIFSVRQKFTYAEISCVAKTNGGARIMPKYLVSNSRNKMQRRSYAALANCLRTASKTRRIGTSMTFAGSVAVGCREDTGYATAKCRHDVNLRQLNVATILGMRWLDFAKIPGLWRLDIVMVLGLWQSDVSDEQQRVNFRRFALTSVRDESNFLKNILFTNETTFTTMGAHLVWHVKHQRQWSFNVGCGIRPYRHFWTTYRSTCIVICASSMTIVLRILLLAVRQVLNETFPYRRLGRSGVVRWSAHSSDITPLDILLWGALEDRVFNMIPTTPDGMQERIVAACRGITPETLQATRRALHVAFTHATYLLMSDLYSHYPSSFHCAASISQILHRAFSSIKVTLRYYRKRYSQDKLRQVLLAYSCECSSTAPCYRHT
ncbi:hypothetical protein PR048_018343 [Dryococelus australis]|uniref:Uncharacterized protein n=1 Tax=Dryococelus australis TaxID=614101 RepID=A0ABQ9HC71_9NEOP|nr:hypothetical protein PR048_018343 [Dryococelus australis]